MQRSKLFSLRYTPTQNIIAGICLNVFFLNINKMSKLSKKKSNFYLLLFHSHWLDQICMDVKHTAESGKQRFE